MVLLEELFLFKMLMPAEESEPMIFSASFMPSMIPFASIYLQRWLMPLISHTPANIAISSDSAVDKATVVCFLLTLWIRYHCPSSAFTQTMTLLVDFLSSSPPQPASV